MWHLIVIVGQATQPANPIVVYGPGNVWTPNAVLELMIAGAALALAIFAVVKLSANKASAEAALTLAGSLLERSNLHGGQIGAILSALPQVLGTPPPPGTTETPATTHTPSASAPAAEEGAQRDFTPPPGWPEVPSTRRPSPKPAIAPAQPQPTPTVAAPAPSKPPKGRAY